jgi:glycosyltransferase involved in cell wall biosynthesis
VLTRDEERNLPRALASIPAGSEILVVDAESRDATAEAARALGARVLVRPWPGFVAARREALALVRTEWTFMLDADEALDERLRAAVAAALQDGARSAGGPSGFVVERRTAFCGRAIRGCGWGDERLVRLVRTRGARVESAPAAGGGAALHERLAVDGATPALAGRLDHDSYPTVASYREKFRRYTTIEASGVRGSLRGLLGAALRWPLRFAWLYLARRGFADGWRGAFVAWHSALYPLTVRWKALRSRP